MEVVAEIFEGGWVGVGREVCVLLIPAVFVDVLWIRTGGNSDPLAV